MNDPQGGERRRLVRRNPCSEHVRQGNGRQDSHGPYRDEQFDYKPLRAKPDDTEVTVRSEVRQSGSSQPVSLDYDMERTPGGWKVYDVKVDGVSLVTTYRDTFATEVREKGVDGLIKSLAAKNREPQGTKAGKS